MTSRPNILHIVTDQQRFDTIHAAGNPHIFTPHLNWLMDTGTIFRRAYCDAPICVPARSTMITGTPFYRSPQGFGNWGQPTAPDPRQTLPGLLTSAGYQTRGVGKLHYHPPRANYGFEHTEILEDYYRAMRQKGGHQPKEHGLGENEMEPVISTVHESESVTHWVAERAMNFLETRDPTRPFYLQVGFTKPHPPLDPPFNYWALYQNRTMPEPVYGDWSQNLEDIPLGFLGSTFSLNGAHRFSPEQLQDIRRAYYACITQIDYNLGLVFARLRELGLVENTLIVFHSDHGEMLGDHHLGAKTVFLEGSAHIPMLVHWPSEIAAYADLPRGSSCDAIVTLADLMPTFLTAAGVERPASLPETSVDMAPLLREGKTGSTFLGVWDHHYGWIEDDWKYLYTGVGGAELLFNLADDPMEQHNLAPAQPDRCRAMHARLASELGRHGHGGLTPESREIPVAKPVSEALKAQQWRWLGLHSRDHTPEDLLH